MTNRQLELRTGGGTIEPAANLPLTGCVYANYYCCTSPKRTRGKTEGGLVALPLEVPAQPESKQEKRCAAISCRVQKLALTRGDL